MNWYLLQLPGLCAATAVLELDDAHVGQWLLSRPFVVGAALGALLGDIRSGAVLGAVLELLTIDDLPMGHRIPLNGTIAAGVSVLLALGAPRVEWGAALPLGLIAGHLFRRVENFVRDLRSDDADSVESALAHGRRIPFGRIVIRALVLQWLLVGIFLYAVVATLGATLPRAWPHLPPAVRMGAGIALRASPWLGLATVLQLLRPR